MNEARIRRLRRLSAVPRWTVIHTIQRQTVAEHTFHVLWIALWLAEYSAAVRTGVVSRERLTLAVLLHDEAEAVSGDVATPFKTGAVGQAIKERERLAGFGPRSDAEATIIRVADLLEASLFISEERAMGNMTLIDVEAQLANRLGVAWEQFEYEVTGMASKPSAHEFLKIFLELTRPDRHPGLERLPG